MRLSKFLLEEEFNKYEDGMRICLCAASVVPSSINDLLTKDNAKEILSETLDLKLGYGERFGKLKLREKIAEYYNSQSLSTGDDGSESKIDPSQILVTTGASEGIFLVFTSLFEAGDTIVVQRPIYQSLYQLAQDNGVNVVFWDYDWREDFGSNLTELKKIFERLSQEGKEIKSLVLNNPNNPTGYCFDRDELSQLAVLCESLSSKQKLPYMITDEVFRDLAHLQDAQNVSLVDVYKKAIVMADVSKSYGFPGLRLGWLVLSGQGEGTLETLDKLSSQKNYLSLRSSTLSESLAYHILEQREDIVSSKLDTVKKNIAYLREFLIREDSPFSLEDGVLENCQSLTCLLKIKSDAKFLFTDEWRQRLNKDPGVFIVDGLPFGEGYQDYFRIGFGISEEDFSEGLSILAKAYAEEALAKC